MKPASAAGRRAFHARHQYYDGSPGEKLLTAGPIRFVCDFEHSLSRLMVETGAHS